MHEKTAWTAERLRHLDDDEFTILWFATFGGPPAALLDRPGMERVFLDCYRSGTPSWPEDVT